MISSALQDKDKIRHKKRWSQIMYMYYLLGYKLMELPISDERKDVIAEVKIFLLLLLDFPSTSEIRQSIKIFSRTPTSWPWMETWTSNQTRR